jgi:hypothetical protein
MNNKNIISIAAVALAAFFSGSASAEVTVKGAGDSIELSAGGGATVEEALNALNSKFGVRFHSSEPLNRRVSGTYSGNLEGVVSQTLAEYSFTIMTVDGHIEVWAMGVNADVAKAPVPARPAAPPANAPANTPEQIAQQPQAPWPADAQPIDPKSNPKFARVFNKDAPPLQMSEEFVNAYANRAGRGNTRRNPSGN